MARMVPDIMQVPRWGSPLGHLPAQRFSPWLAWILSAPGWTSHPTEKRREVMWLWECELRQLGLRRLSTRYWQCERRYGLPAGVYLSVFPHAEEKHTPTRAAASERFDVCAFHVTFCLGVDRVHFYFHELAE